MPFNDVAALEQVLTENGSKVAAIIMEPVMGSAGFIAGNREYLAAARRLSEAHGALLILDEVMTFRLDSGGAAERRLSPMLPVGGRCGKAGRVGVGHAREPGRHAAASG